MNKQNILNITMETELRQTVKNNIKLDMVYTCGNISLTVILVCLVYLFLFFFVFVFFIKSE